MFRSNLALREGSPTDTTDTDTIWVIDASGRVCKRRAYSAFATGLWRLTDDPRTGSSAGTDRWFPNERAAVLAAMEDALERSKEAALAFREACALHGELAERLKCLPLRSEERAETDCSIRSRTEERHAA